MPTISVHVDSDLAQRVREAAQKQQVSVSQVVKNSLNDALPVKPKTGRDIRGAIQGWGDFDPEEQILPPWNEEMPEGYE